MSQSSDDHARRLFTDLTVSGSIDLERWCAFKREHDVQPQQIEPVLVQTIEHLCRMSLELTQEVGRLSHALHRRSG